MNWGYRLLCTFIVFIAGMGYLVYRAMTTDFELVEKEYYKREINYQQVIDGTSLANALAANIQVAQRKQTLSLVVPGENAGGRVSGHVWLYCAYDSKRDRHFELSTGPDGGQDLDIHNVVPGVYTIKIEWTQNEKTYYSEKRLSIE